MSKTETPEAASAPPARTATETKPVDRIVVLTAPHQGHPAGTILRLSSEAQIKAVSRQSRQAKALDLAIWGREPFTL